MIYIEPAVASLWSSNKTTAGLDVGSELFVFSVAARWAGLLDDKGAPAMVPGSVGSTDPKLLRKAKDDEHAVVIGVRTVARTSWIQ
jgi:hypothetical protein